MNNDELNKVSGIILDSAIEVHKQLGRDYWKVSMKSVCSKN